MALTRQTRVFLWLAGGVLTLGVVAGLVVSYAGSAGTVAQGGAEPSELKYLPADARMVARVDLRRLTRSALHAAWVEHRPAPGRPDDPLRRLGLDVEADVDAVLVGTSALPSGPGLAGGLLLVRGRFDMPRIEQHLAAHAGRSSDYKGVRVLRFEAGEGQDAAVALLEPGLLAVGPSAAVTQAIDGATGVNLTANDEVMRLVRSVATGDLWVVGQFDAAVARRRLPGGAAGAASTAPASLPAVTWFTASARVDRGLDGTVRAEARNEADAANLRDLLQGIVALARLQAGARPGLDAAVNSLQLTTQGTTVSLSFAVPPGAVSALIPTLPSPRPPVPPDAVP